MSPSTSSPHEATSWDSELFVLRGDTRDELRARIEELASMLVSGPEIDLSDLACRVSGEPASGGARLAIVAGSLDDLEAKLARAAEKLADPACEKIRDVTGVYYFAEPLHPHGKIAFLFPGEGAQYLNMAEGLAAHFPALQESLAYCDEVAARPQTKLTSPRQFIEFPRDASPAEREAAERELRRLGNAMTSVIVTDLAIFHVLEEFGLTPDMIAGHSAGELAALMASGCMSDEHNATERVVETVQLLEAMEDETGIEPAVLLAVGASREKMNPLLAEVGAGGGAFVAMDNCPHQTVLVGRAAEMTFVEERLQAAGYVYERLTLSRPYHTALFEPYSAPLAEMLEAIGYGAPKTEIYSCTTAQPFPADANEMRRLTLAHWFSPVEFTQMIRNMHDAGARLFVEVGPRGNLTSFVEDILRGRQFIAIPADVPRRSSITQLHHLLGQLAAHNVPLRLTPLYQRRGLGNAECGLRNAEWEDGDVESSVNGQEVAAPQAPHRPSLSPYLAPSRSAVVASHLALMDQFLSDQESVMHGFLANRIAGLPRRSRGLAPRPETAWVAPPQAFEPQLGSDAAYERSLPMLGEIVHLEPGQEVTMRRRLDLSEDLFAAEHTVGGRMISKVRPDHYGLPIGPMTFTLELMAETATLLAPGSVALEVKDVRLLRWLAYYKDAPGEIEATAKLLSANEDGLLEVEVRIAIIDNGNLPLGETGGPAAVGRVVLAPHYPEAPLAGPFELAGRRPCRKTIDDLYHDLFHGPLFTGVTQLHAVGDAGIEAQAVVLPRRGLFAATDDPQFLVDPVLLDVFMHPLCVWHLEQPDLSGRTLLPFELKSVQIFGPRPAEGTTFEVRGIIEESSPRHFVHALEAVDETGRVWCRLTAKYWRFYMPCGEINFHGRKDEYFLGVQWPEAIGDDARSVCVRLEPPMDLHQPAMQMVTAKVTLSDDEMREYLNLTVPPKKRFDWVFGRLAAKDAVRLMWHERHGERFFPADMELKHDEHGRPFAVHLGYDEQPTMPNVSVSHADGVMAALASFEPHVGIDLEKIEPREASFEALAFDSTERQLLDIQADRAEAVTRFWCAKEAVAKALGRGLSEGPRSVVVRACQDDGDGKALVEVELGATFAAEFPQFAGRRLRALTTRHKNFIVATTLCDEVVS